MRKSVILLCGWLLPLLYAPNTTFGQSEKLLPVKDEAGFRKVFAQEASKIKTIQSSFEQQKTLSALEETITSTGRFWFKRDSKVRIDYEKPFMYTLVLDRDKIVMKDEYKENRVNTGSSKMFQQVNKVIVDCVQGTVMDNKDFTSKVFENSKYYMLELQPVGKTLKGFFSRIILKISKSDFSVDSMEMIEQEGDKTVMKFSNKVLNNPIADEIFKL